MVTDGEGDEYNERVEQVLAPGWEDHQMRRKMTRKEVIREESVSESVMMVVAHLVEVVPLVWEESGTEHQRE